jgi:hypothetical protein
MGKQISLFQQWQHDSTIQRPLSTIEADWSIKNKGIEKRRKTIKTERISKEQHSIEQIPLDPITPTWLPMVKIMHNNNISVLNAAILPISNGIVPFTNVEHVEKQHQDTHHELVMDVSMMMESMDIMTLMATRMEILPENVDLH